MLTFTLFLPLVGALFILFFVNSPRNVRAVALMIALVELGLASIVFWTVSQDGSGSFQLVEKIAWVQSLNIQYFLGVDGLSAPLILLTGLLTLCAVFASWYVEDRVKEHFFWMLTLITAVMGVFMALDLVLFFVFWELELIPMYFLISIWGTGRKEYSAMKFLIFTIAGSAFMLIGILVVFLSSGTFDMTELAGSTLTNLLIPTQLVFLLFFVAFAIKLPIWPVHTWLPDAHTDAPTAGSVILAGVLIKMGGYGLIRINTAMFPETTREYAWIIVGLALVSVIYGAIVTLRQSDLKRLIAYSSVSHMGLVLLGIASLGAGKSAVDSVGLNGSAMQMFTHGTITGLMFLVVGQIYLRTHTRFIPDLGGLAVKMPFLCAALVVSGLASLGLPGLSGFVSEALVFLGAFHVWPWPVAVCVFGIVLTAGYILWMIQRVVFGPESGKFSEITDARLPEIVPVVLLVASILVVGLYPAVISDVFSSTLSQLISTRFG
ncbi:NADH-quinone oxidoreductase subunit M [SAR202 cluster bacterium AD-493-K16_JPT_193m]|nr:NADH-quinone oxidoreductase subunit M [SAR202 cluster bacterium AD-493-K16_JPT_193m]